MWISSIFLASFLLIRGSEALKENFNRRNDPTEKVMIIGGEEAEKGRYPYIAAAVPIYPKMKEDFVPHCIGTLIAPQWVLVSAVCSVTEVRYVYIGGHNYTDTSETHEIIEIERAHKYYDFDPTPISSAMALIKLVNSSSFTPININGSSIHPAGNDVTIVSWGFESVVLEELEQEIMNKDECDEYFTDIANDYYEEVPEEDACLAVNEDGAGACFGDFGSPVIIKGDNSSEDFLAGIVAWRYKCSSSLPFETYPTVVYQSMDKVLAYMDFLTSCDSLPSSSEGEPVNYDGCDVPNPCFINDDVCNIDYFTEECAFDGGDCGCFEEGFPNDGFDYSECDTTQRCWLNDNICDVHLMTAECVYDGLDCLQTPALLKRLFRLLVRIFPPFQNVILSIYEMLVPLA